MNEMKNEDSEAKTGEKAFEKAVIDYRERIYLMLLKYVRNREDAKDLTQETFIKAYNSLGSFRGESGLYTWIYRIAVNLAINYRTRSKTSLFRSIDDSQGIYNGNSPSDNLMQSELSSGIDNSVRKLPERQRMVFVLRYYEEKPYSEIAEILGTTEGAAKANYHHAIRKLKSDLGDYLRGDSL
ncbi:MAG: sigma-70 family RNA polymerase sigma factor [Candidatus Zixiibacteriota bacterium]|nr:MAG: sigma-70 family RNA polymerase sigma factor [candidate division Zixibacteria bacterium]